MGVLQKLVCKKVKHDDFLKRRGEDVSTDDSSSMDSFPKLEDSMGMVVGRAMHPRFASSSRRRPLSSAQSQRCERIRTEMGDLDLPAEWILNLNILGLHNKGAPLDDAYTSPPPPPTTNILDSIQEDFIVENVRRSLRKKNQRSRKPARGFKEAPEERALVMPGIDDDDESAMGYLPTMFCSDLRNPVQRRPRRSRTPRAPLASPTSIMSMRQETPKFMLASVQETETELSYLNGTQKKPLVSALRRPSSTKSHHEVAKKARFKQDLEEYFQLSPPRLGPQRYSMTTDDEPLDDSYSYEEEDSSEMEESVESLEVLFNHMVCAADDRLLARDWVT